MSEVKCPFCSTPVRIVAGMLGAHSQAGGRGCIGSGSSADEARRLQESHAGVRRVTAQWKGQR